MKHLEKYDFSKETDEDIKKWYPKWKKKTEEETGKAIDAYKDKKEYKFNNSLYGEYKRILNRISDEKCFYCESIITDTHPGDVEHYRPKSEVYEDKKHPGYYWLAYDESNFLLSCEKCNRGGSKSTHFPIKGVRVYKPGENLDKEEALLLNPLEEKPEEHLDFCPKNFDQGKSELVPVTPAGKTTIETCNLNRERLAKNRSEKQVNTITNLNVQITIAISTNEYGRIPGIFYTEIKRANEKEYSAACIGVINRKKNEMVKAFQSKPDP